MIAIAPFLFAALAQEAQLPHNTFRDSTEGWALIGTMSPSAKVAVSHDPAHLKVGVGSLQFDYSIDKGETNVLNLPIADGALAKMKSMDFWIQSDYATTIAVVLQEKDAGRYLARFAVPKGKWQKVELAPSDFALSNGPGDPADPDGKLDLDQVESVSLLDLDLFFAQSDSPLAALFGVVTGPHTLYLSDFQASPEALANVSTPQWIDSFARPQIQWIPAGGNSLAIASDASLDGQALQATYHTTAGLPSGMFRAIYPGQLAAANQISFKASSQKPIKLLVQLEESNGNKFDTVLDLSGGSTAQQITVQFSDLKPADDSKDKTAKFEPSLVSQLILADLSGMLTQTVQDNVLRIGKISAKP